MDSEQVSEAARRRLHRFGITRLMEGAGVMTIFTPTGLSDALADPGFVSPARWLDEVLGGFETSQDQIAPLRLASGPGTPLLTSVHDEVRGDAFFFGTTAAFLFDDRNDDFLLSGLEHGIGGDWNDLAVSAGHRASRGFENSAVQARQMVGFDLEIPGVVADLPSPEIWPGASDDDFLLVKNADLPTVLPAVEDFDYSVTRMSDGELPSQWTSLMLTFSEDGAVPVPTDDLGRPHGHDDWLF